MPNSMTGFGRAELADDQWQVNVEIKTVNHRYADIAVKMPKNLSALESAVRKLVSSRLARGRVEVYITVFPLKDRPFIPKINWSLASSYVEAAEELRTKLGLTGPLSTEYVLSLPDVVTVEEAAVDEEEVWLRLQTALEEALDQVLQLRRDEGRRLVEDILTRVDKIAGFVDLIEERSPQVVAEYAERLAQRMTSFLEDGFLEPERIGAEAALFAERSNITEEIIRLRSHLAEIRNLVQESGPIGRKLDFMVQELNREINTIGSKANDEKIASVVINCKSEIEKIREQAQNLE
ncbi:MAG: YicC family protein [Firmicutes bacterium]|nr:YicC family protein [Bacillota bacterium]